MSDQTPPNHQCAICGKWYKANPQRVGMACAVFHGPGSCCHYSEIEVVTPPMPDKTPETCQKCGHYKQGTHHTYPDGTLRCDYVDADSRCDCATPPTEPQEVEDMAIRDEINRLRRERGNHLMDEPHYVDAIVAIIARERTSAAIDELTAFKDLAMVYSDGSPANMIVMDEEEAVTYIDDRIAALAAQQKGEQ